jgi:L-threonylcarbamoyladenylate synthase
MPYTADTYIARIDPDDPDPHSIALAGQVIQDGGLVAFPTETVYGLGANALSAGAVAHIFEAKERPENDPVIVHLWRKADIARVAVNVPEIAYTLADAFWPGALTLVLQKHTDVPDIVTAGQPTVAIRVPSHPVAQALIRKSSRPIAAPSANRFSRPSPTNAAHVLADLEGRVDVILNAGNTSIGVESTIVSLATDVPTVLRPGGVPLEALRPYLPTLAFRAQYLAEHATAPAPGTLAKHYSPGAEVRVFEGAAISAIHDAMRSAAQQATDNGQSVGIMARDSEVAQFDDVAAQIVLLGETDDQVATQLFAGLRALDSSDVDVILVRAPQQTGLGLALYDRLIRAAEGHVVHVK